MERINFNFQMYLLVSQLALFGVLTSNCRAACKDFNVAIFLRLKNAEHSSTNHTSCCFFA